MNHDIGYFTFKDVKVKDNEELTVVYGHFIGDHEIFNEDLDVRVTFIGTVNRLFWKWSCYSPNEYRG